MWHNHKEQTGGRLAGAYLILGDLIILAVFALLAIHGCKAHAQAEQKPCEQPYVVKNGVIIKASVDGGIVTYYDGEPKLLQRGNVLFVWFNGSWVQATLIKPAMPEATVSDAHWLPIIHAQAAPSRTRKTQQQRGSVVTK